MNVDTGAGLAMGGTSKLLRSTSSSILVAQGVKDHPRLDEQSLDMLIQTLSMQA